MFNKFMNWLVPKLEEWCLDRPDRVIMISGTDDPENVYLLRSVLFRSKLFCIYIHRFLRSDKDDHHDHPFDFLGYVVKGGYIESRMIGNSVRGRLYNVQSDVKFRISTRKQGAWGFRRAEDTHMVLVDKTLPAHKYKDAPLTVIFRGPYRRDWGFWKQFPVPGSRDYYRVHWRTYLGASETETRE